MKSTINNLYAVILAGGRSRRFGGSDKAWLQWQGQPLIQHVIVRLQPQVKNIVISANRNVDQYAQLGFPVIPDIIDQNLGPLMGIYSVMEYLNTLETEKNAHIQLLTIPCDMPQLPYDLVKQLQPEQSRDKIHAAHDGQRLQPLVSLIPLNLKSDLKRYLDENNHKVDQWIIGTNPLIIDFANQQDCFHNINDQTEFDKLPNITPTNYRKLDE